LRNNHSPHQGASRLNIEQKTAVRYIDGPLLVLAGAGSGKTSVITEKVAYLIKTCHIKPQNIFAVTFTNKAAREMKERVGKLISGEQKKLLNVSTFHTLGLNIIREEIKVLPLRIGFSIFDSDDSQMLLKDFFIQNVRGDNKLLDIAQHTISGWKNALIDPTQALSLAKSAGEQALAIAYQRYNDALRAYNAVDFDDLIQLPVMLLENNAAVRERWQHKVRYMLVDEYQDTNSSQYQLVKLLVGDMASLTAVGDDDQSIYAWRGARPENLNQLQQDFPHLKIIKLEQNYRSTERILKAANTLIKNNPHLHEKKLWSELGYGEAIRVLQTENEDEEAERIATEILTRCARKESRHRDFAVLYRGNHQSRLLEIKLQQHRIPYAVSGGTSFFARTEIKDIMAYLRLLANPDDDNAFLRIINTPRRKIGAGTLEKLANYVQDAAGSRQRSSLYSAVNDIGLQQHTKGEGLENLKRFTHWMDKIRRNCYENDPISAIHEMINDMGYQSWLLQNSSTPQVAEKRMENVNYLIESLASSMKNEHTKNNSQTDGAQDAIGSAIAKLLLQDLLEQQEEDDLTDRVQLMTMHAAKGLEFPHVFIMGMEENLLPHRASIEQDTIEEERRLAYVGVTRARQTLTFTLANQRKQYGDVTTCVPSRFLNELPEEDLEWEGNNIKTTPESKQKKASDTLASLKGLFS
jgi:ATP-dependent DNA helicase Rep